METMIRNKAKEEMEVEAIDSGILEVATQKCKRKFRKNIRRFRY